MAMRKLCGSVSYLGNHTASWSSSLFERATTILPAKCPQLLPAQVSGASTAARSCPITFATRDAEETSCPMVPDSRETLCPVAAATRRKSGEEEADVNSQRTRSMHELDGPPAWPIVGNFLSYLKKENQGRMHEVQARHHKSYGRMFREKWGSSWQVHISDPDLMQQVFRKEGRYPNRPSIQAWVLYRTTYGKSQGLVTAQGKEWQTYRTEFARRMRDPKATHGFAEPLNAVADDLVRRLRHVRDTEGDRSLVGKLPNEMYKWSLEAAGAFLFETRLGCLDAAIPERTQEFITATQDMMAATLYLIIGEKLHKKLNTRFWNRHKLAWDKVSEIGKELIDKRLNELSVQSISNMAEQEKNEKKGLYLTHLLRDQSHLTMEQIYSNITDILLAASDSTANSFCFVLHLLANNKEALARAREEISTVLGGRQDITSDDVSELKYLRCVLKEAMRLYPIITMNCRILEDDIVLDGYFVPKKTLFVLNTYASGRDEACFNQADRFLPERWFRDEQGASRNHPFACLPFGFGQRNCIGQRVSKMVMIIALAKILQNFNLDVYPNVELKPVLRTLLTPGDNVPIVLRNRSL